MQACYKFQNISEIVELNIEYLIFSPYFVSFKCIFQALFKVDEYIKIHNCIFKKNLFFGKKFILNSNFMYVA